MKKDWEALFVSTLRNEETNQSDGSHDLGHFQRVSALAKQIAALQTTSVDPLVTLAAAYFHDIVCLPKNHADASLSSSLSAKKAAEILEKLNFPREKIASVCHAIEAHSFSAKIPPQTIEAKIIQDADRMEALGALGIMRAFYVSGRIGSAPYHPTDLMGKERELDDRAYALDHFECKLFKLPSLLQTEGGKKLAKPRVDFLHQFIHELQKEERGALLIVEACREAGAKSRLFFSLTDPFGEMRPLEPEKFVLDHLLQKREKFSSFLSEFIDQLREEIHSPL